MTVHRCPPLGSGVMPCCGRTPFEAPADRITTDPGLVTCLGRERIPAEAYEHVDADLGDCPYLARYLRLPGHDPDAVCDSGCYDEPECVTGAPREGWPSLTGYTPELVALWRDLGGGDA